MAVTQPSSLKTPDRDPDVQVGDRDRLVLCCAGKDMGNIDRLCKAVKWGLSPDGTSPFYQALLTVMLNQHSFPSYVKELTADRVISAYLKIIESYQDGNEIFLFGFYHGAFIARMVARLIGEFGIPRLKDSRPLIKALICIQKLDDQTDVDEKVLAEGKEKLITDLFHDWARPDSPGRKRLTDSGIKFAVKCLGLFEGICPDGSFFNYIPPVPLGEERKMFGLSGVNVGDHVERIYQALTLNDLYYGYSNRHKIETSSGESKGHILRRCWFPGGLLDVGGVHSGSGDLSLVWMMANVSDILVIDTKKLTSMMHSSTEWGMQRIKDSLERKSNVPAAEIGNAEMGNIHSSILEQQSLYPELAKEAKRKPGVTAPLLKLECHIKSKCFKSPSLHPKEEEEEIQHSQQHNTARGDRTKKPGTFGRNIGDAFSFGGSAESAFARRERLVLT